MSKIVVIALACLALGTSSDSQDEPKPTLRDEPLTAEQVAIYRVVLETYRRGNYTPLNLADRTEPLHRSEGSSAPGCIRGIKAIDTNAAPVVHRIASTVMLGPRLVLVDPDRLQERTNENDPENLTKRFIDGHEQVTDKRLDDSVKQAFQKGVFTAVRNSLRQRTSLRGCGLQLCVRRSVWEWKHLALHESGEEMESDQEM